MSDSLSLAHPVRLCHSSRLAPGAWCLRLIDGFAPVCDCVLSTLGNGLTLFGTNDCLSCKGLTISVVSSF